MATSVQIDTTVVAGGGADPAELKACVAAVPQSATLLSANGLRVTSDMMLAGFSPITRRINIAFGPSVAATAAPVLTPGTSGKRVESVTVTAPGLDYIRPPIVSFTSPGAPPLPPNVLVNAIGVAFLQVAEIDVDTGGAGYITPFVAVLGGLPPADVPPGIQGEHDQKNEPTEPPDNPVVQWAVRRIALIDGGRGYPPGTTVSLVGGHSDGTSGDATEQAQATCVVDVAGRIASVTLTFMGRHYVKPPSVVFNVPAGSPEIKRQAKATAVMAAGSPALAHATVVAGVITAIVIDDPGDNYITVPQVVITDLGSPPGSGATAHARMSVGKIVLRSHGQGYDPGTTVTLTPLFDSFGQPPIFGHWIDRAVSKSCITPAFSTVLLI